MRCRTCWRRIDMNEERPKTESAAGSTPSASSTEKPTFVITPEVQARLHNILSGEISYPIIIKLIEMACDILKQKAVAGNEDALCALVTTAFSSTAALNGIRNLDEALRKRAQYECVWPALSSSDRAVCIVNEELFERIGLKTHPNANKLDELWHDRTPELHWAFTLHRAIAKIQKVVQENGPEFKDNLSKMPTSELPFTIEDKPIMLAASIILDCIKLPPFSADEESLAKRWKVMKQVFKRAMDGKPEEHPAFKGKYDKAAESNSDNAASQLAYKRSNINAKVKKAFFERVAPASIRRRS
jgi:hypothetical protein